MVNKQSFCFIIAFHNFATLQNMLTYECPSSWLVVITMEKKLAGTWKKKYRILAGPNEWPQVCNRSNLEKTGRSCEGADFSWLSSKVSQTLMPPRASLFLLDYVLEEGLCGGSVQDGSPHMSFILKGSHISALQMKGWFKSKTSIQEYRNEILPPFQNKIYVWT
jgi:hypothetical protein